MVDEKQCYKFFNPEGTLIGVAKTKIGCILYAKEQGLTGYFVPFIPDPLGLYYIDKWSQWLDDKIQINTISNEVRSKIRHSGRT